MEVLLFINKTSGEQKSDKGPQTFMIILHLKRKTIKTEQSFTALMLAIDTKRNKKIEKLA